jgi:altronate dehydratase small subunit
MMPTQSTAAPSGGPDAQRAGDDPRILRLSPRDNVAPLKTRARRGEAMLIAGQPFVLREDVAVGHKIAVVPIAAGTRILKYGAPIGSATADIEPGQRVHTHNMKSDYIPTYTHDRPSNVGAAR